MDGGHLNLRSEQDEATTPNDGRLRTLLAHLRAVAADIHRQLNIWRRPDQEEDLVQALRKEQFADILRRVPINAAANMACSLLLTIAIWSHSAGPTLVLWLATLWLISGLGLWRWHAFRAKTLREVSLIPLKRGVRLATLLGLIWGTAMLLLTKDGVQGGEFIAVFVAAGMASGAAAGLASLPPSAIGFVLGCLLPSSAGFFLSATLAGAAMGCAVLVFAAYLMHTIWNGYRTVLRLLRIKVQQDRLSMALVRSQKIVEEAFREVEDDLMAARAAQMRLMPKQEQLDALHHASGLKVEGHFEPCMHLGGDHWSIISPEPEVIRVCISDFSGHGVAAALNSFSLVALLARMREIVMSPGERSTRLNADLCRVVETGQFATVLLGDLNYRSGKLTYAAAGGPPPLLFSARQDDVIALDSVGLPMGISQQIQYQNREIPMAKDQALLLYSDALTEALDRDDKMIGRQWVDELVMAHVKEHGPDGIVQRIVKEFRKRASGRLADDLTVVAIWYAPEGTCVEGQSGT